MWTRRILAAGATTIRTSGRFTLNAQPSYQDKVTYRALVPACGNFVASSTKPFTITGV
jgi:hypothetical protein